MEGGCVCQGSEASQTEPSGLMSVRSELCVAAYSIETSYAYSSAAFTFHICTLLYFEKVIQNKGPWLGTWRCLERHIDLMHSGGRSLQKKGKICNWNVLRSKASV